MATHRALCLAVALTLAPAAAFAQGGSHGIVVAGAVGLSTRGLGHVNACCGPYQSDVERFRTPWFGGSLSTRVAPRLGIEGEFTWARESVYSAFAQGPLADAEVRLYAAENRVTTSTVAGVVRFEAWRSGMAALELIGGGGLVREQRRSELRSGVIATGPGPAPVLTAATNDARNRLLALGGIDLSAGQGRMIYRVQARVHRLTGALDDIRTDLEAGRTVWRFGVAAGRRF